MKRMHPSKYEIMRAERGLTFIEIIVATAILAVGMLGVAHLQVSGARFNTGSYARTQATIMASGILEEMRSHGSARAAEFDAATGAGTCDRFGVTPQAVMVCWNQELVQLLPGGNGDVAVTTDATGTHVQVTINWTEVASNVAADGTQAPAIAKSIIMEADI